MSEQRGFGQGAKGRGQQKKPMAKGGNKPQDKSKWRPLTRLGRLVDREEIKSLEEIFKLAIPIKEFEIVDKLIKAEDYKEEVMKVKPVQKMTSAGQRTRFKVWVLIGDGKGHIGLGQKSHKEVQGAVQGAVRDAKMNIVPVRMSYWGNYIGQPHTVPFKVSGKNGSVRIRLVPAPRGTGLVGGPASRKVLQIAGIKDCYTQTSGSTKTTGNFLFATFNALRKTYTQMNPNFWGTPVLSNDLFWE
jgi:ribosomal protein uS5